MEMSRRDFLKGSALLLGSAVTAAALGEVGCVASTAPTVRVQPIGQQLQVDTARPELVNVRDGIQLEVADLFYPILLIKLEADRFVALSTECMHLGCRVKKLPAVIRCPCHGSVYDLEGNVLNGPTERPLRQYRVHLSRTIAQIDLQQ
jgi:menaquinol-cytochrome c reductase iron-sulfur subunit